MDNVHWNIENIIKIIVQDEHKAAFTLIFILTVYILLVNKIYQWPHLYIKT